MIHFRTFSSNFSILQNIHFFPMLSLRWYVPIHQFSHVNDEFLLLHIHANVFINDLLHLHFVPFQKISQYLMVVSHWDLELSWGLNLYFLVLIQILLCLYVLGFINRFRGHRYQLLNYHSELFPFWAWPMLL